MFSINVTTLNELCLDWAIQDSYYIDPTIGHGFVNPI